MLAVLALHANQVVSADRLIDELWGEHPPSTAVHTVQVFVSRLRSALAPAGARLLIRSPGYVLELALDELDAARCQRLSEAWAMTVLCRTKSFTTTVPPARVTVPSQRSVVPQTVPRTAAAT